jgi:hypothetical protein
MAFLMLAGAAMFQGRLVEAEQGYETTFHLARQSGNE